MQMIYPCYERTLKCEIDKLIEEWRQSCENQSCENKLPFVSDGFYPYYTSQDVKILFVGKESYGLDGCDYIEVLYKAIKSKKIGKRGISQHKFHTLMLYVVYGLQHGFIDYESIPHAEQICECFAEQNGISYAFMNLSKLSNESGETKAKNELIDYFLDLSSSKSDFFAREIELLNPDLIIGMNLNEGGKRDRYKYLGELKNPRWYGDNNQVCAQKLITKNHKEYDFLDCYHFSAPRKKWKEDYYDPIVLAVKDILSTPQNS